MHAAWSDGVLALCLLLRGRLVHCERLLRTSELDSLEACAHALVDVTIALVHFAETEQEAWPRLGFYDYGSTMGLYAPGLDALVRFISGPLLLATSEARPGFSAASTRLLTSVRALPDKHPRGLYNFDVLARLGLYEGYANHDITEHGANAPLDALGRAMVGGIASGDAEGAARAAGPSQ